MHLTIQSANFCSGGPGTPPKLWGQNKDLLDWWVDGTINGQDVKSKITKKIRAGDIDPVAGTVRCPFNIGETIEVEQKMNRDTGQPEVYIRKSDGMEVPQFKHLLPQANGQAASNGAWGNPQAAPAKPAWGGQQQQPGGAAPPQPVLDGEMFLQDLVMWRRLAYNLHKAAFPELEDATIAMMASTAGTSAYISARDGEITTPQSVSMPGYRSGSEVQAKGTLPSHGEMVPADQVPF